MLAKIIDGKKVAASIRQECRDRVDLLRRKTGIVPGLAVILVGDNAASTLYVASTAGSDPAFWEEFRGMGRHATDRFLEFYGSHLGRTLTAEEVSHIRFAFQMVRGTLNNTILNEPGPLRSDDPEFLRQTERAFRLVAGIASNEAEN